MTRFSNQTPLAVAARPGQELSLLGMLVISSLAALGMLGFRFYYSGTQGYQFLWWNLFLAWIPLWLAGAVDRLSADTRNRHPTIALCALLWLLFLPNAPYLVTDFLHLTSAHSPSLRPLPAVLSQRSLFRRVPEWYDVMMLASFAWNGLVIGFLSLYLVQRVARERLGIIGGWVIALVALTLCGFGVSLGRFERWNSWDLFSHPGELLRDIWARLTDPLNYPQTLGSTLLMSGFLIVAYLTLCAWANLGTIPPKDNEPIAHEKRATDPA